MWPRPPKMDWGLLVLHTHLIVGGYSVILGIADIWDSTCQVIS